MKETIKEDRREGGQKMYKIDFEIYFVSDKKRKGKEKKRKEKC